MNYSVKSLKEEKLAKLNYKQIPEHFFSSYDFEEYIVPNYIQKINAYAFYNCKNLKIIMIPKSVTEISNYAFYSCKNLKFISISNFNTFIQNEAFYKTPFENIFKKLGNKEFINFLNEKDKFKYIKNEIFTFEDISFLLDEEEYKGYTNGVNYGI